MFYIKFTTLVWFVYCVLSCCLYVFFLLIGKLIFSVATDSVFSYNGVVGLNEVLVVVLVAFSLNGNL